MANKKSLQEGGMTEVRNNMEYLLSELQDKIQNQNIPVQQSVADLVSEGNNPQEIAQALLQIGYKEDDIKQIFNSLPKSEEDSEIDKDVQEEQQQQNIEQPQKQQEKVQQMEQEGVVAKKGKQMQSSIYDIPKAKQGMAFRDWMRQARRHGSINQNEMYQAPEARYLPMQKESYSAIDAMKNIGSNLMDFIDKTKTWNDNKEHLYNYKVNVPEGVDIDDYAINAKELYRAATEKDSLGNNRFIRTKDNIGKIVKNKSRMYYGPKKNRYSFDIRNPYEEDDKKIDRMRKKEFGANYMKKSIPLSQFQGFDYDQSQAIGDYMYNKYMGNTPKGTVLGVDKYGMPIYQTGDTDYDLMLGQKKFNVTQNNVDNAMNNLYNRKGATLDWVKKQLGGNTHNTYHGYQIGGEPLSKKQWYLQNPEAKLKTASEIDSLYKDYIDNFQYDDYEIEYEPEIQTETINFQEPTATITNKGWGDFRKGLDKFGDVAEATVNITGNVNKFLRGIDYDKQLGDATYQSSDSIHGIDDPEKGFWTYQQEGILQPDHQTEWMAQKGKEMNRYQKGKEKYHVNPDGTFDINSKWFKGLPLEKQRKVAAYNQDITRGAGTPFTGAVPATFGSLPSRVEVTRRTPPNDYMNPFSGPDIMPDLSPLDKVILNNNKQPSPIGGDGLSEEFINALRPGKVYGDRKYGGDLDKYQGNRRSETQPNSNTLRKIPFLDYVQSIFDRRNIKRNVNTPLNFSSNQNKQFIDSWEREFLRSNQEYPAQEMEFLPFGENGQMISANFIRSFKPGTTEWWLKENLNQRDENAEILRQVLKRKMEDSGRLPFKEFSRQRGGGLDKYQKGDEVVRKFGPPLFPFSPGEREVFQDNLTGYFNLMKENEEWKRQNDPSWNIEQSKTRKEGFDSPLWSYGDRYDVPFIGLVKNNKRVPLENVLPGEVLREYYKLKNPSQQRQMLLNYDPNLSGQITQLMFESPKKQYGGSSDPFSTKRQLRKKKGGQVANISTEVLKRLQATKGAKFNIL